MKLQRDVFRPVYPTPAALITCLSPDGRANIITLGEVYMLALEPLVIGISIRPSRYSHQLIDESGEFVVNFPTADLAAATDYCGVHSGRKVDKFAATGLTPEPATHVRAPLIKECPFNIECRLREILPMGSHDVFVGDALVIHVEDWALDQDGHLDPVKARALAFVGRSYWVVGERIRRAFQRDPAPEKLGELLRPHDRIAQHADAGDIDLHHVADGEGAGADTAGGQNVAR